MDLLKIIREYLKEVKSIDELFKQEYNTSNVLNGLREGIVPKEGIIAGGKYYFHGIGCRVIFPSKTINFDYGPNGLLMGVDKYDILDYIKESREIDERELFEEFSKLVKSKNLLFPKTSPNESLFYIAPWTGPNQP